MAVNAPPEMVMKQPTENGEAKQDDRPGAGGRLSRRLHVLTGLSDVGAVLRPSKEPARSRFYGRRYGYDPG
jgi:hypothetical protein